MKQIKDFLDSKNCEYKDEIIRKKKVISFNHNNSLYSYKFRILPGYTSEIVEVYREKKRIAIHDVSNVDEIIFILNHIFDNF